MSTEQQTPQPRFSAQRKAWVWQYVKRCVDKAMEPDERRKDAYTLIGYEIDEATDKGGKS
jgi:hypothetical protein